MEEMDQFAGKVVKVGNSLMVTIPSRTVQFAGIQENDLLKVWVKKKIEDIIVNDE